MAIKRLEDLFLDFEDCKKMVRELLLLKALQDCPFVTKLLDIIEPPNTTSFRDLYFVMEFVESDLKKVIRSTLSLSELHVQVIAYNLLCGLKWIHSAQILHRDIKPSNILINEECHIKICDFGLARTVAGLRSNPFKMLADVKGGLANINEARLTAGLPPMTETETKRELKIIVKDHNR